MELKRKRISPYGSSKRRVNSLKEFDYDDSDVENQKKNRGWNPYLLGIGIILFCIVIYESLHYHVDYSKIASYHNLRDTSPLKIFLKDQFVSSNSIVAHSTESISHELPIPPISNPPMVANEVSNSNSLATILPQLVVPEDARSDLEIRKQDLLNDITVFINDLRRMKNSGVVMETDITAKEKIEKLQDSLRAYLPLEYGPPPYFVEMKLSFPPSMEDFATAGEEGIIIIEMAPIELIPYCVYYFLQTISSWKGGAFHRNAGHVLQAMVNSGGKPRFGLAFQEYHPAYPHVKYTLGYAGRPGGPEFYISTVDNTKNHGPGSQGSATEADGCFGKIWKGIDVVDRMKKQPGKSKPSGFVSDPHNYIRINSMRLLDKSERDSILNNQ